MITLGLVLLGAVVSTVPPAPFGVGERLEYTARYNFLRPGSARLAVAGVDTVDGRPAWRFTFDVDIDVLGVFKNSSRFVSWTDTAAFVSRRFVKTIDENGTVRHQDFRIDADGRFYQEQTDTTRHRTGEQPIDDVAFFYYVRRIPLEVGRTYQVNRYWRDSANPVTIEVVGRKSFKMPDGKRVDCLVLHPIVDEPHGMFSKRSRARLWLTDDDRRIPVQIESTYPFGTVKLVLNAVTASASP